MNENGVESLPPRRLGRLIFEVFRLNGRLLAGGDALVAELGLSSARWQVLWAIDIAADAEPVAQLARLMGLNRQGVQRIVNELAEEGLVSFADNPAHARAKLVAMTARGREVYEAAARLRRPWLKEIGAGISDADLEVALRVIAMLRQQLD